VTQGQARSLFPALSGTFGFFENAGGSQVPHFVPDAIRDYMLSSYVQLGAGYPQSDAATKTVEEAHNFMAQFLGAPEDGLTILGPSTTALIQLVANAYAPILNEGDEIVIAESNHEANVGGWLRLEQFGAKIVWWPLDPVSFRCEPSTLVDLVNERTRVVALPHVSNLLGQIEDLAEVSRIAHSVGARVMADGVALAPHRAVDVQTLGVDWYVFSAYKVYGPHIAVMFGTREAFAGLRGPNHGFIAEGSAYKWELGGAPHEACAGLLAVRPYFSAIAGETYGGRATILKAFAAMHEWEQPVDRLLREGVAGLSGVTVVGPAIAGENSVPTVSFAHARIGSDEIARRVNARGFGVRNGNMYAVRLLRALGIPEDPGVVRVSAVHYNTVEEANRLLEALADAT
jgi:cysteine desulfurase family protein (TIGR01976 family)